MKQVLTTKLSLHPQANCVPQMPAEQFAEFRADIAQRGIRVPIEILPGNIIIDGRSRWTVAKELGLKTVPTVEAMIGDDDPILYMLRAATKRRHLTDDQRACLAYEEMEYLAELSRSQRARKAGLAGGRGRGKPEDSSADDAPAKLTRNRSQDARTIAAQNFSVSERQIRKAKALRQQTPELYAKVKSGVERLTVAKREAERDQKRQARQMVTTLPLQRSRDTPWEIRNGDCLEEMNQLDSESVQLAFADPPYNIGVDYGSGSQADKLPEADYLGWCRKWMQAVYRLLTDSGSFWVLINDEYADHFGVLLREAGFYRRSWIKWYETFGVNCSNNFNRCSRHLFYCIKSSRNFIFHKEAVSRPSDRQTKYKDKRANPAGKLWDNVWQIPRLVENSRERLPDFPTQLPLALLRPVILCSTNPSDLILDPFSGSGTTGVVALENNRRFLGIERNSIFANHARQRLASCEGVFD